MSNQQHYSTEERILELLTVQATEGLSPLEEAELEVLLLREPKYHDFELEEAAAALDLAWQSCVASHEPMPESLAQRIANEAPCYMMPVQHTLPAVTSPESHTPRRRFQLPWGTLGWVVAAACLLLAIWNRWQPRPDTSGKLTPQQQIARWQEKNEPVVKAAAKGTEQYQKAKAEFYWNSEKQEGYMKLTGLPKNDPQKKQYQLWIFDGKREKDKDLLAQRPVDGGLFNINEDGTVYVPINAKVKVFEAKAFAITGERPGGVVVSNQKDLVVLAKPEKTG